MLTHKIYQLSPKGDWMPSWISYFCCIFLSFFLCHLGEALSSESELCCVPSLQLEGVEKLWSQSYGPGKSIPWAKLHSAISCGWDRRSWKFHVWGGKLLRNESIVLQKVLVPSIITLNLIKNPSGDVKYDMGGLWHSSDSWSFWEWRPKKAIHAAAEVWRQQFWGTGSLLSKSCVLWSGSVLQGQRRVIQPFDYTNHK